MQIFIQSVWRNTSIPYTNALDMSDNLFYFCNVLSVVKMWPSALQSVEISCLFPSWTSSSYRKVIVLRADCHNKDLRKLTMKFLWINIFQNRLFLPSRGLLTTFLCFLTLLRQFQKILIWIFFFSKLPSKSVLSIATINFAIFQRRNPFLVHAFCCENGILEKEQCFLYQSVR